METNPSELEAAGESGDGEPDRLNPGGEKARGMNRAHGSTSQALPPLALECSTFRRTVWAHMDPCRRKRLNLEDFEERLNVVPSTADKVSIHSHTRCMYVILVREGRLCAGLKHELYVDPTTWSVYVQESARSEMTR